MTGGSAERVLGLQMTQRWREKVKMVDEGLLEARKSFVREKMSAQLPKDDIETKEMERSIDFDITQLRKIYALICDTKKIDRLKN